MTDDGLHAHGMQRLLRPHVPGFKAVLGSGNWVLQSFLSSESRGIVLTYVQRRCNAAIIPPSFRPWGRQVGREHFANTQEQEHGEFASVEERCISWLPEKTVFL